MLSSTTFLTDHAIVNDTSLAAVSTSDSNRHIFFQEQSWNIRAAVFTYSSGKWSALTSYVIVTNAKHHTPLSAIQIPENVSRSNSTMDYGLDTSEQVSFDFRLNNILL